MEDRSEFTRTSVLLLGFTEAFAGLQSTAILYNISTDSVKLVIPYNINSLVCNIFHIFITLEPYAYVKKIR